MKMSLSDYLQQVGSDAVQFFLVAGPGWIEPNGSWRIKTDEMEAYLGGAQYGAAVFRVFISGMRPQDFIVRFIRPSATIPHITYEKYTPSIENTVVWSGPTSLTVKEFPVQIDVSGYLRSTNTDIHPTYVYIPTYANVTFIGSTLVITDFGSGIAGFNVYEATSGATTSVEINLALAEQTSGTSAAPGEPRSWRLQVYASVNTHLFIDLAAFFNDFSSVVSDSPNVRIVNNYAVVLFTQPGKYTVTLSDSGHNTLIIDFNVAQ
jgi:hypothetical protein